MEDNNNNLLVKGLAIILIAILGLNVYRTETTKKEMAQLATTVEQLSAQLDSIGVAEAPVGTAPVASGISKKEFSTLSKSVSSLESKVTALQGTVDRLAHSQSQTGSTTRSSSTISELASSNGRVSVSAKVKVENRYVQGKTPLPNITTGPTGVVIINVSMDQIGIVGSVSVNSNSTITDEDIQDLCKEAALKTDFAYNPYAPNKSTGTITYIFTAK